MKYYLIVTSIAFGLITLAHFARIYVEGLRLVSEPFFVITTIIAISLCIWAIILMKQKAHHN